MVNTSTGPRENPEASNDNRYKKSALADMLEESLRNEKINGVSPEGINTFEKNVGDFVSELRVKLKRMRDEAKTDGNATEGWASITDGEIDNLSIYAINQKVVSLSRPLVSARSKFFSYIKDLYPDIRNHDDWESKIRKAISEETRSDLESMIKNMRGRNVRSFLSRTLELETEDAVLSPRDKKNMRELFGDPSTLWSEANKKLLTKIYINWEKYNNAPSLEDLVFLMKIKRWATTEEKIKILSELAVTLPLSFLLKYNLINDDDLERILTAEYGNIYRELDNDNKRKFKESLTDTHSDEIEVSLSALSMNDVSRIFTLSKEKLSTLYTSIQSGLSLEEKVPERTEANILKKASEMYPDEDDHQILFNKYIRSTIANIVWIENLSKESIIEFGEWESKMRIEILRTHDESGEFPYEVNNGLSYGIRFRELNVKDGYLRNWAEEDLTYDAFYGFFKRYHDSAKIITKAEFEGNLVNTPEAVEWEKLYDARDLESKNLTKDTIIAKLDEVDEKGREFGFGVGTYFSAPEEIKWEDTRTGTWQVLSITDNSVVIRGSHGVNNVNVSLEEIYALAKAWQLRRTAKIIDDRAFLSALTAYGIATDAQIEDGLIVQKNKDESGAEKKDIMRKFSSDSWWHIRIMSISDGKVMFWEYDHDEEEHKASEFALKNGTKASAKKYYKKNILTYWAFLAYLWENSLKNASSHDPIDDHKHDHHDHDHSHMEWSLLSRLGKMQSIGSMWKGLEMVWHSIEHSLEKWSKLDAARFAMKFGKILPGDSIEAQLFADIVDGSKDIVEKLRNKLNNLPGPKGRKKCIHIAHNKDARPEEVVAAIQYMVQGYGHLYAEDIRQYQSKVTKANIDTKPIWYFAFLDGFIHSARLPGWVIEWRKKCYEKAKWLTGNEWEPPEEMLIHALFKSIDGNYEKYPYAASVVKAIGGPGAFEKDWDFEGRKNAMQKWRDQTTMVNAQGRLNKAVGYLATHELNKAMWSMEKVVGKVKDANFQAVPVVWALGGYTRHMSPQALQDLKNYGETWLTFHAYAFLRKHSDNLIYRDTMRLAVSHLISKWKMSEEDLKEMNAIIDRMDNWPEDQDTTDKQYKKINPPAAMADWWQKHCNSGLSDMMQGNNNWLVGAAMENQTVRDYRKQLIWVHSSSLKDGNIPGGEIGQDYYNEHGFQHTIRRIHEENENYDSINSMLNKISFEWPSRWGRPMNENNKEKIWRYVLKQFENLRDPSNIYTTSEKVKKAQFLAYRKELVRFFNNKVSAWDADPNRIEGLIRENSYYSDIARLGIDPHAVFDIWLIEKNAESDYQNWKTNQLGLKTSWGSGSIINAVKWWASYTLDPNISQEYRDTDAGGRIDPRSISSEDSDN
jgi:hypothetical protein